MALLNRLSRAWARVISRARAGFRQDEQLEDIKILQGRIQSTLNRQLRSTELKDYEFRVFSQWGEDGIIQKLIDNVSVTSRTFIEFGVEDFRESNCRFLMMKDNWSGLIIDGSARNVLSIRHSYYFWRYGLTAIHAFITRENINQLMLDAGFSGELGILSIDLDSTDYHIWEAITAVRPCIVIIEYNSVFGPDRPIVVPYDASFQRTDKHYSNLYFGSSLTALAILGRRLGYALVGGTSEGVNAFFVREDLMNETLRSCTPRDVYVESKFRESRWQDGRPSLLGGAARYELIKGLPVINVETNEQEVL